MEEDIFTAVDAEDARVRAIDDAIVPTTPKEKFFLAKQRYMDEVREYAEHLKRDPNVFLDDADIRFSTSLPLSRIRDMSIVIVGAGGIGNWQWRALLGMGFRNVVIFDDDKVGLENVGPQAHSLLDLDMYKVDAVRDAAIQYRGISIAAVPERVRKMSHIVAKIGYVPDIVITCTDSTEFRNDFINDLVTNFTRNNPRLILDYRMSLGDWTCYATPMELMYTAGGFHNSMLKYYNEAVFPHEEAVQESCTERAIVYTGMNVASYTGAILHWFITEFEPKCKESVNICEATLQKFYKNELQFGWKKTFSARDFEQITLTTRERSFRNRLNDAEREVSQLNGRIDKLVSAFVGREVASEDNPKIGDYLVYPDCGQVEHQRILATAGDSCVSSLWMDDDGKYHVIAHHAGDNKYGVEIYAYSAVHGYSWNKDDLLLSERSKNEDDLVAKFMVFQNLENNPKIPMRVWDEEGTPIDVYRVNLCTGEIMSCKYATGGEAHKYVGTGLLDMIFENPDPNSIDAVCDTITDTTTDAAEEVSNSESESETASVIYDKRWGDIRIGDVVEFECMSGFTIHVISRTGTRLTGYTNEGEKIIVKVQSLISDRVHVL